MSSYAARLIRYEEVIRRLGAALRGARLYGSAHPTVSGHISALLDAARDLHLVSPTILIGFVGGEIIADDIPLQRASAQLGDLVGRLERLGISRITIDPGITLDELTTFVLAAATATLPTGEDAEASDGRDFLVLPHLRAGPIQVDPDAGDWGSSAGAASAKLVYTSSVAGAESVWESAKLDGQPDMPSARDVIENLAEAVAFNRPALIGLTAMQRYDNYTFTHMVNVSILTMGQARALGIDGRRLRDIGLGGLMHDIGKVRVPSEILTKDRALTDAEFTVMKRHTSDGALILRRTADMPAIAPVMALEHHLRIDGTGYPDSVRRTSLNLGTQLCSIADVYDAMRSQRRYQQAFPTDRILEVMKRNDGRQMDQHLVRRFVQLLGIYPPGSFVKLNTGEIAVVVKVHAPDPARPAVRVVLDADGRRLDEPRERHLWEPVEPPAVRIGVVSPIDPIDYGLTQAAS